MIQVSGLYKSYALQTLFEDVTFSVNPGERLGLIGRNGHGKTTLFRIFAGTEEADAGKIHFSNGYRVGYLSQHLEFKEKTILAEAALGLPVLSEGLRETYRAEAVLHGLGFSTEDFERSPDSFSGGFQIRLNLAKLLVSEPNLLLLDEPTNYLDIISLRWLVNFLRKWPGELILITHDHEFMNQVSTHTLGIHRSKIRKIAGPTTKYYEQLKMEEEVHEQSRKNQLKKIEETEKFIDTFRAKASKAKAVQSRIKALDRMGTIEKLDEIRELSFRFTPCSFPGKRLLDLENVSFSYPDQQEILFSQLSLSVGAKDRIAVIGRNGKGKSTLLQLIAGGLKPVEGKITHSPNLQLAYFGQTNVDRLTQGNTIEEELLNTNPTLSRTQIRTIAGHMMFEKDSALKRIKVLSGGEKSRVLLGKLLLTPANLLILDEPSNHLDMQSTDALLEAITEFPGAVMIVTHSEMFLRAIATKLIVFDRGKVEVFDGSYDDFLRRVGWDGEEDEGISKSNSNTNQISRKELRRLRGEVINRRSKELGPLQNETKKLENYIRELEQKLELDNATLIEITRNGFGDDGAKLLRQVKLTKTEIEQSYEKLEQILQQLDQRSLEFEQELQSFN